MAHLKKSSYPRPKMVQWVQQVFKENGAGRALLESPAEMALREIREWTVFGDLTEVSERQPW